MNFNCDPSHTKEGKKPVNSENKPKIWIEMAGEQIITNHCGDWLYLGSRIFWLDSEDREAPDATHSTWMRSFVPRTDMFVCVKGKTASPPTRTLKQRSTHYPWKNGRGEKKQNVSFFRGRSCRVLSCNLVGRLWVSMSWEQQRLHGGMLPFHGLAARAAPSPIRQ